MEKLNKEEILARVKVAIEKTEKKVSSYREITKPVEPENAIGRISRMDAINNKSVSEAALRKAEEKLSQLKYILTKIDSDDFGICARCGNPIPVERILFVPQSIYCVRCSGK